MGFRAVDPATGTQVGPEFHDSSTHDVHRAVVAARMAARWYSTWDSQERQLHLNLIADRLDAERSHLCDLAERETALPRPRLEGELDRTIGQFRNYADWAVRSLTTPEVGPLTRVLVPLGPVAVFGASNFPFAFGVAGTDTASALAAGCPVVAKSHPAHPQTSAALAQIVAGVWPQDGPGAVFALLQGEGHEVGRELVLHPDTAAVAFTGSLGGGRALFDLAARREVPIPAYCEMGSLNPVVVSARALRERGSEIAQELARAVGDFAGQRCTKPGLVLVEGDRKPFVELLVDALGKATVTPLLDQRIAVAFTDRVQGIGAEVPAVTVPHGQSSETGLWRDTVVLTPTLETVRSTPGLTSEIFGPAVVVAGGDASELSGLLGDVEPSLAASLYAESDDPLTDRVLPALVRKVGRLVLNGAPTGLDVVDEQQHGGPYPASSDARATSVGGRSVERFLRPVAFQGFASIPFNSGSMPADVRPTA